MNVAARQHRVVVVNEFNTSRWMVPAEYEGGRELADIPAEPVGVSMKES
jgi:hypothetical protein